MIGAIRAQPGNEVVGMMSSDARRGAALAAEQGFAKDWTSISDLLADSAVDAVTSAPPMSRTRHSHCHCRVLHAVRLPEHLKG